MSDDSATHEGVQKSKRDQDYEALVAAREAERTDDPEAASAPVDQTPEEPITPSPDDGGDDDTKPESGDGETQDPGEQGAQMITLTDDEGNEYQVPKTAKMRLKIDGAEVEESFDRVTRGYQKGAAADKRLEQATLKQRELEERERDLTARGEALTQQEQAALAGLQKMEKQHKAGALSEDAYNDLSQQLVKALLEDDDPVEGVAKILPQILQSNQSPLDQDELDWIIESKFRSREERRRAEARRNAIIKAQSRFAKDYSHLDKNPLLRGLVNEQTKILVREKPDADPWEIIKEAAEYVETGLEGQSGSKRTGPKPKPTPRTASARASVDTAPKPQTREEALAEMREKRVGSMSSMARTAT
jgi:hypothetical protein